MKTILIAQARSTNSRLPGKNFLKIGDKSIIEHHVSKLSGYAMLTEVDNRTGWLIDKSIIATPYKEPRLKDYQKIAKKYGWVVENPDCNEEDVLRRFVMICNKYQPDWIVRTTCDCWKIDTDWVQKTIKMAIDNNIPVFNSFNEGSTVEVFPAWCLYRANNEIASMEQIECTLKPSSPAFDIRDNNHIANYRLSEIYAEHRSNVTSYFRKGFSKGSIDDINDLNKARAEYDKRK